MSDTSESASRSCGTCRHWRDWRRDDAGVLPWVDQEEHDDLGDCLALDTVSLPYAWRWAQREVVSTQRGEGVACPTWAPLPAKA